MGPAVAAKAVSRASVRAAPTGAPLDSDVIVLAVPYTAAASVVQQYGDQLAGKIVVDITNPVDPETYAPLTIEAGSVAQEIAQKVPGARVAEPAVGPPGDHHPDLVAREAALLGRLVGLEALGQVECRESAQLAEGTRSEAR